MFFRHTSTTSWLLLTLVFLSKANTLDPVFYGEFLKRGNIVNFLSPIRNQNQPSTCGASWVFAIASAMSDHFNLIRDTQHQIVTLSPQVMLTCSTQKDQKTCEYKDKDYRLDIEEIFEQLKTDGVPDETCNVWTSDFTSECDAMSRCQWALATKVYTIPPNLIPVG